MFDESIQYGYKYERDFGVFLVRRLDGETLCYDIPVNLYYNIMKEYEDMTGSKALVGRVYECIHFDSACRYAIIDFRRFDYTQEHTDEIVRMINEQYIKPKKEKVNVLSRIFKRK